MVNGHHCLRALGVRPIGAPWTSMVHVILLWAMAYAGLASASADPMATHGDLRVFLDPKDGPDVDLSIAVEDDEVRFSITTNLAFLDATTDVFREDPVTLAAAEAPAAMAALTKLFRTENVVEIDGNVVLPVSPRIETDFQFDPGDASLFIHFERFGARAVAKTRLVLRYPCKTAPRRVAVTWGVWPPNEVLAVDGQETPPIEILCRFAAGGVDRVVRFKAEEPQFTWHRDRDSGAARFAPVPDIEEHKAPGFPWPAAAMAAVSLALAIFGPKVTRRAIFGPLTLGLTAFLALEISARRIDLPSEPEAIAIFEPLHENIYRAFDYTDESAVYDALSQSVDGELLSGLYDEVYRSLVLQEEGGAVSKVTAVRHTELNVEEIGVVGPEERPGFSVDCLWQVDGAVYHWGHAHTRTNEYRARYTVHAAQEGWRIAASEVLEQRRLSAAPLADLDMGMDDRWRPAAEDGPLDGTEGTDPEAGTEDPDLDY